MEMESVNQARDTNNAYWNIYPEDPSPGREFSNCATNGNLDRQNSVKVYTGEGG